MKTLGTEDAARLLQLNVKAVQRLARAGKLPAARVGRRWLFHLDQLQRLLGRDADPAGAPMLELSARNRLTGTITRVHTDGLMAEVLLRIGDQELVSIITRSSAERMALAEGQEVYAVVKSTEVMIGRQERDE